MLLNQNTIADMLRREGFELSLGAGFFGFYAHLGFIKALDQRTLIPKKIFGASAGAIVGAFWASGKSIIELENIFLQISRKDFWDPSFGLGLLKGKKYNQLLAEHLPMQFSDLKIPLDISIFDIKSLRTKIINSGNLHSSVRASSAFPGLFQPVKIEGRYYIDGGLGDELALGERKSNNTLLVHAFNETPILNASAKKLDKQSSKKIILHLNGLPECGPRLMHLGGEIIEMAYRKTLENLDLPPR